jgi:hypothetical protein
MRTTILLTTLSAALAASTFTGIAVGKTPAAPSVSQPPVALPIPPPPPRVAKDANGNPMPPAAPVPAGSTQIASVPTASPFAVVDRNRTGVVTKDQANSDPWLSANFARCDADNNSEVSQTEYEACSTQLK